MDFGSLVAICITIVATIAGVATIMSTIRYMKSENSKVLKVQSQILVKIEDGQEKGFANMANTLAKIEEGQREGFSKLSDGFNKLSEDNVTIAKILERIESNTGFSPQTSK